MFKKLVLVGCATLALGASAKSLDFRWCSYGAMGTIGNDQAYVHPTVDGIVYCFRENLTVMRGASVTLLHGDKTIAHSSLLDVSNYSSGKSTEGHLTVWFDHGADNLQKGERYTLHLAERSLADANDATVTNEAINISFYVPKDLGEAQFNFEQGARIASSDEMSVTWRYETLAIGTPRATLLREGVKVGEYPLRVEYDWDLGYANIEFGKTYIFDKDVNYSLEIPAASVCCRQRSDILNRKAVLNFVGDSDQSAIGEVEATQEAAAELFDLNGRRLAKAPAAGIYLERRGGRTIKRTAL